MRRFIARVNIEVEVSGAVLSLTELDRIVGAEIQSRIAQKSFNDVVGLLLFGDTQVVKFWPVIRDKDRATPDAG